MIIIHNRQPTTHEPTNSPTYLTYYQLCHITMWVMYLLAIYDMLTVNAFANEQSFDYAH